VGSAAPITTPGAARRKMVLPAQSQGSAPGTVTPRSCQAPASGGRPRSLPPNEASAQLAAEHEYQRGRTAERKAARAELPLMTVVRRLYLAYFERWLRDPTVQHALERDIAFEALKHEADVLAEAER
jgi:hypothetical protein